MTIASRPDSSAPPMRWIRVARQRRFRPSAVGEPGSPSNSGIRNSGDLFEDALDYPHVTLHEGSTLCHYLKRKALEYGKPLPVRIQVFGFESACRMIEAGVGVGVLPASCATVTTCG
ncbi:LysR substrate-binding domain-containing protein [Salinicola peritrichatus]|uniref:LysR substrate-binding domain-containing protein n=1 Tax=Salinicola peritrichatus TaxID=1267424 RepID=UPI000DA11F14